MMSRKVRQQIGRILFSVVFLFVLLEVGMRIVGTTDADGQFYFQGERIPPYQLPIEQLEMRLTEIEAIEADGVLRTFIYNDQTGWSPRPDHTSVDGKWTSNSVGIRASREYDLQPADDMLRIALFGGSFTAGDEVSNKEMWATVLEETLNEQGIRAEVINFGVNAFGTDQAYLRWQALGQAYDPDIVIVGFLPENTMRNVNVIRPIYLPNANMLYSKPRFIFNADTLELINVPPIPQDDLADVMRQFPEHPLAEHEYHYQRMRQQGWWLNLRLVGVVENIRGNLNDLLVDELPAYERNAYMDLTNALVAMFAEDVTASEAVFQVAFLPGNIDVRAITAERDLSYQSLLDEWTTTYDLIDVSTTFDAYSPDDWMPGGHYSPERNTIVGASVADYIVACLADETCQPPRFADQQAYRIDN
jgi:hypothetical protein